MKRRNFVASISALAAASCAPRIDERKERYDKKECPFCTPDKGKCGYCHGTGECSFCNGTGKRVTSTKNYTQPNIEQVEYEEECPYCKGSGKCKYCDGVGECWACHGTGEIDDWNFYERSKKEKKNSKKRGD
jgi:RecJ-like exonuclease